MIQTFPAMRILVATQPVDFVGGATVVGATLSGPGRFWLVRKRRNSPGLTEPS